MTSRPTRRRFLAGAAGTAALAGVAGTATAANATPTIPGDPFTMGVASGDPGPRSVILWTRLAPDPTNGGGMPDHPYWLEWQVASDEAMTKVVRSGVTYTGPGLGHSVHVEAKGLQPGRWYWYRFKVGGHLSPVGRTRTAPAHDTMPASMSLGLVSCQRYSSGYYAAYADLVARGCDLVFHAGDYIYESGGDGVRTDPIPESVDLEGYRNRYGLYRTDPSLQAAHASAPWIVGWDDHEVENNYQGITPELGSTTPDQAAFLARRAAAYRAWWEHMPVRKPAPSGPSFKMHRRVQWGRLATFHVLDTRQYRTDQICNPNDVGKPCLASYAPEMTMLGAGQERWLRRGVERNRARWNVLAQAVAFTHMAFNSSDHPPVNLDQWDGYPAARRRLLDDLWAHNRRNNVVLAGDIHSNWVGDVARRAGDGAAPVMGAEFVVAGVSSSPNSALDALRANLLTNSDNLVWGETQHRSWVHHRVTPAAWTADYRLVADHTDPASALFTDATWVLPRGGRVRPG